MHLLNLPLLYVPVFHFLTGAGQARDVHAMVTCGHMFAGGAAGKQIGQHCGATGAAAIASLCAGRQLATIDPNPLLSLFLQLACQQSVVTISDAAAAEVPFSLSGLVASE